jgi:hypothetical protein
MPHPAPHPEPRPEPQRASDRRTEPRFVVVGLEVAVEGRTCSIIDISRSGVRVSRPAGYLASREPTPIIFTLGDLACPLSYAVSGTLVRQSPFEIVYRYVPPCDDWEKMLKSLDTFACTQLHRASL